jgi:hypothetical protein
MWVLKNSSSENWRKIHRARMPYKRFSRNGWTFSVIGFEAVCAESEFFNSHGCSRQSRIMPRQIGDHLPTSEYESS